ncbi:hypothetical protein HCDG_00949 [Histoplasma capsulatum H143]|uniref:Uncharacterized protein n=1 Tax=Ajellomyces capsulatus (strain H143) TaxID=544712 RepID=C6H2L7_AJECH|nr:hypothetical protein HCDG_00949 [Histoplasma capsulatum H143]
MWTVAGSGDGPSLSLGICIRRVAISLVVEGATLGFGGKPRRIISKSDVVTVLCCASPEVGPSLVHEGSSRGRRSPDRKLAGTAQWHAAAGPGRPWPQEQQRRPGAMGAGALPPRPKLRRTLPNQRPGWLTAALAPHTQPPQPPGRNSTSKAHDPSPAALHCSTDHSIPLLAISPLISSLLGTPSPLHLLCISISTSVALHLPVHLLAQDLLSCPLLSSPLRSSIMILEDTCLPLRGPWRWAIARPSTTINTTIISTSTSTSIIASMVGDISRLCKPAVTTLTPL